ncbi:MAG: methyltransferase domain-containing protein [Sulfuritalea sp.]|nr:methyltransferase domain-containing protein [Sulfuritalea sp.]
MRQAESIADGGQSVEEEEEPIRLHIGGVQIKEGWKILNVEAGEGVDFVGDVRDLSAFGDGCCSDIYASHVLEHVGQAEVLPVFNELHRMLRVGGKLYVSVPDLEMLSWLFLSPALDSAAKFNVMRMMFGGQTTPHDFHQIGYCFDFLVDYLRDVGFAGVEHVESFGLFNDTSEFVFAGQRISLNLIVTK